MSFKVTIDGPGGQVIFQASVPVTESRSVNYENYNIVHLPTDIWAYRNTSARRFSIQGKLVSRTPGEAGENVLYLNLIRRWTLPGFGDTGATPPIVKLSAYQNSNIDGLNCIIRSYSWTFPDDVDYIYTASEPMPVIGILGLELDETYTAEEITAQKWVTKVTGGGNFETGAGSDASSFTIGLGGSNGASFTGLASGGAVTGLATVGNLLQAAASAISQAPSFTATLNIDPSSVISEVTAQIPEISNNPLLKGLSVNTVLNQTISNVSGIVAPAIESVDEFGRNSGLNTPSIVGDDGGG